MNQTTILTIAIPFALSSYVALWPAGLLASNLGGKLRAKEEDARRTLIAGALKQLKGLRVKLDDLFRDSDSGNDPFLRSVRPNEVLEPAREYVRLMLLQVRMGKNLRLAQKLARTSFWILVAFSIAITATLAATVTHNWIGREASQWAILMAAVIFFIGSIVYLWLLVIVRRLDWAHVKAGEVTDEDDGQVDFNSLSGADD